MRRNRKIRRNHDSVLVIALGVMGYLLGGALITFMLWAIIFYKVAPIIRLAYF